MNDNNGPTKDNNNVDTVRKLLEGRMNRVMDAIRSDSDVIVVDSLSQIPSEKNQIDELYYLPPINMDEMRMVVSSATLDKIDRNDATSGILTVGDKITGRYGNMGSSSEVIKPINTQDPRSKGILISGGGPSIASMMTMALRENPITLVDNENNQEDVEERIREHNGVRKIEAASMYGARGDIHAGQMPEFLSERLDMMSMHENLKSLENMPNMNRKQRREMEKRMRKMKTPKR